MAHLPPMHTATQSWMYARAQPDTSKLAASASVPRPRGPPPPQGVATTGQEIERRKAPPSRHNSGSQEFQ